MLRALLSPYPLGYQTGMALLRIVVGLLIAYHGLEVFDRATIESYTTRDVIKALPAPLVMVYLGKGIELVAGVCLALGLLTRIAAILMTIDLLYICFFVGDGRFYYEDQHPFLFALLGMVFIFTGPVQWSVDHTLFRKAT